MMKFPNMERLQANDAVFHVRFLFALQEEILPFNSVCWETILSWTINEMRMA